MGGKWVNRGINYLLYNFVLVNRVNNYLYRLKINNMNAMHLKISQFPPIYPEK